MKANKKKKKSEEIWSIIKDLVWSITKHSHKYDEKYMKIKFDLDDDLPLNKTIKIHNMTIIFRATSYENDK